MIRIIEVGPRDGLQNEKIPVPLEVKLRFIAALFEAGLPEIEATSFVSPKWVPQLGDSLELVPLLPAGPKYSALVPNVRGLESALAVGMDRIAVFTAASSAFTEKNINMTVEQSLEAFADVLTKFRDQKPTGFVRGYVSTAFDCPFSGRVPTGDVVDVVEKLLALGVDEISIGDTIGTAVPADVKQLSQALGGIEKSKLVWHFHDTRGAAISCVSQALDLGFTAFDSSAAGLGGCPYAPGAGGNLATDDLVYFCERSGLSTGVNPEKLAKASLEVLEVLQKRPFAKAQQALLSSL